VPRDNDTMSFTVQMTAVIKDMVLPSFIVYQNPVKDFINLFDVYKQIEKTLIVFTVNGSVVIEYNHPSESMDSSRFAPCVYYGYPNYSSVLIYEKFR
jgi:hypothetical protein